MLAPKFKTNFSNSCFNNKYCKKIYSEKCLQPTSCNFTKKGTRAKVFSYEFSKNFQNRFVVAITCLWVKFGMNLPRSFFEIFEISVFRLPVISMHQKEEFLFSVSKFIKESLICSKYKRNKNLRWPLLVSLISVKTEDFLFVIKTVWLSTPLQKITGFALNKMLQPLKIEAILCKKGNNFHYLLLSRDVKVTLSLICYLGARGNLSLHVSYWISRFYEFFAETPRFATLKCLLTWV